MATAGQLDSLGVSSRAELEQHLSSLIGSGRLRPGQRVSTARLAKEWNISESTVHQSLHVLASKGLVVRRPRLGTFVSPTAGSAATTSTTNLVLVLPDTRQPEFVRLSRALHQAAKDSPWNIDVNVTDDHPDQYTDTLLTQIENKAGAIVLVPPLTGAIPVETLIKLYKSGIPVINCFRGIDGFGWPLVRMDVTYNTRIAAKHLCELGRRNIGLVLLDPPNSHSDLIKEFTFINTLEEYDLSSRQGMRISINSQRQYTNRQMWLFDAVAKLEAWLQENPNIDGICCMHDLAAWAVLTALAKIGRRVPEDIALVGNGDLFEFFGMGISDLTTVDCAYDQIGDIVLRILDEIHPGQQPQAHTCIEVKGRLIARQSTIGSSARVQDRQ